jgi:hypothetical protein
MLSGSTIAGSVVDGQVGRRLKSRMPAGLGQRRLSRRDICRVEYCSVFGYGSPEIRFQSRMVSSLEPVRRGSRPQVKKVRGGRAGL